MDGTKGVEQVRTVKEEVVGAKWPTYDDIRQFAFAAVQRWTNLQPFSSLDAIDLSKLIHNPQTDPQIRSQAERLWKAKDSWTKTLKDTDENFPEDQHFELSQQNRDAILFMFKMFKEERSFVADRFIGWVQTQGLTPPFNLDEVDLPANFIEQISKRKDLQRIIAGRKRREKAESAV